MKYTRENNVDMVRMPNGIKMSEDLLTCLPWSRCSGDARYNGRSWDGSESWTVLVECGDGKNHMVGLGYDSRDSDGNWDTGIYTDQGFFEGEDAYEKACSCWGFNW